MIDLPTYSTRGAQPVSMALLPSAMLKIPTAAAVSGLSVATIYRRAKTDPTFPRLHRLGARAGRRPAGRRPDEPGQAEEGPQGPPGP